MQILIPIADAPDFFPKSENFFPKPLVDVVGKPMIERVVNSLREGIIGPQFVFVASRNMTRQFSLAGTLELVGGADTKIVERVSHTKGALPSCLLAIDEVTPEQELLVCNSDQLVDVDIQGAIEFFRSRDAAAGVLTFQSVHPRWSYVQLENSDEIVQAFEKRVVSNVAVAGIYYFRRAQDFFAAAQRAILVDDNVSGDYYISAALNQIILAGGTVLRYQIESARYHPLYSPEKIKEFLATKFAEDLRSKDEDGLVANIVIPAAGEGSRFAREGWTRPKPFIDVCGQSMIETVIGNVTVQGGTHKVLLRKSHIELWPAEFSRLRDSGVEVIGVDRLTEGTACTVLLARSHFDNSTPLIIANSDQLVDFDANAFLQDCLDRGLDGSILVFRDHEMNPKWSFAKLNDAGLVVEVAEKNPISDLATVGIYLFRRGSDFVRGAVDMIANNDRVNNEFYTCPVYNYMIKNGAKIGVFEVAVSQMHGLGTPEDLVAYLSSQGAPPSGDAPSSKGEV